MFEKLGQNFNRLKENVTQKVGAGVDRLKQTFAKIQDRATLFSDETKAELMLIVDPVVDKVKGVGNFVSETYKAPENKNMWYRLERVVGESVLRMKEGLNNMGTKVSEIKNGLVERYRGLGVIGGATQMVDDALEAVAFTPTWVMDTMENIQQKKIEKMDVMAQKYVKKNDLLEQDDEGDLTIKDNLNPKFLKRLEQFLGFYKHVGERRDSFARKANEHYARYQTMKEARARIAMARAGLTVSSSQA